MVKNNCNKLNIKQSLRCLTCVVNECVQLYLLFHVSFRIYKTYCENVINIDINKQLFCIVNSIRVSLHTYTSYSDDSCTQAYLILSPVIY